MTSIWVRIVQGLAPVVVALALGACASAYEKSLGGNPARDYSRIFYANKLVAQKAVYEALSSFAKDDTSNPQAGIFVTKYQDNVALRNSIDSLAGGDAYIKAQFRLRVSLAEGKFNGLPSVKVAVIKEQLVLRDVLEGYRTIETDGIEEQSLLYRIGRLIAIQQKMDRISEQKASDDSFLRELDPGGK